MFFEQDTTDIKLEQNHSSFKKTWFKDIIYWFKQYYTIDVN